MRDFAEALARANIEGADHDLRLPPAVAALRPELERLEKRLRADIGPSWPLGRELLDRVFATGGKRLRPALVFATARLGSADPERVTALAAAVETLHAATLVHDDLVDGSLVRRGVPTLNASWSEGATVLAGDWLFARAARFAAATGSVQVMDVFARTLGTMTEGELRQLDGRNGIPTRQEYEYRIYAKTAALFEACTEAAAVLSLGVVELVGTLARFGRDLGIAFQIVDDVLDFWSTEDQLGKPVGSDLRTGTVTLPVLLFLEAIPEAMALLVPGVGATSALEQLIALVRSDRDSRERCTAIASEYLAAALEALRMAPLGEARLALEQLARFAVERRA